MAFHLLINGNNYDDFVHRDTSPLRIVWPLNNPQNLTFALLDPTGSYGGHGLPQRDDLVQLDTGKYGLATFKGFVAKITEVELKGYVSTPIYAYVFSCYSQEYELNRMSVRLGVLPSLQGRKAGDIIKKMTDLLLPGKFDYSNIDDGEYQPEFTIKADDVWSDIVRSLCDHDRKYYAVLDGKIYYKDIGDAPLGVGYNPTTDATITGWNAANMSVGPTDDSIYNDYIVVGEDGPKGPGKAHFIGDGFEGNFPLQIPAWGVEQEIIIDEVWDLTSSPVDNNKWEVADPTLAIQDNQPNLQLLGGAGISNTFVRALQAIELRGAVRLIHGECQFTSPSDGRIGGLFRDFSSTADSNQVFGFKLTKVGGQTRIEAMVDGNTAGITSSIAYAVLGASRASGLSTVIISSPSTPLAAGDIINVIVNENSSFNVEGITVFSVTSLGSFQWAVSYSQALSDVSSFTASGIVSSFGSAPGVITQDNHTYVLITRIYSGNANNWETKFFAPSSPHENFGGLANGKTAFVTFEVWDYTITAAQTIEPVVSVIHNQAYDLSNLPAPFLAYTVVQATDLHMAINFTEVANPIQVALASRIPSYNPNGVPVVWNDKKSKTVGFGIDRADATVTSDSAGNAQLQFYPDPVTVTDDTTDPPTVTTKTNLPIAGEKIELQFQWEGKVLGRARDFVSVGIVAAKYGAPDDGVRTKINDKVDPPVRSDEDAFNAAAAFLTDSVEQQYQGTYGVFDQYCSVRPIPGRYFNIADASLIENSPRDFIISQVTQDVLGDHNTLTDVHQFSLQFGPFLDAALFAAKLNATAGIPPTQGKDTESLKTVDILAIGDRTAYIGDAIEDWDVDVAVIGDPWAIDHPQAGSFRITVNQEVPAGCGIEVRRWDKGWGIVDTGVDAGLIYRGAVGVNIVYVPRTSRNSHFYMRFYKGAASTTSNGVISLSVTPDIVHLTQTQAQQLSLTAITIDGTQSDVTTLATWVSENSSKVSVNSSGLATALVDGPQDVEITATYQGISISVLVHITPSVPVVFGVTVTPSAVADIIVGKTIQFTAKATYSDGTIVDVTNTASWSSTDGTKVSISASGLATGVAVGSANIKATFASVNSANIPVNVVTRVPIGLQFTKPFTSGTDGSALSQTVISPFSGTVDVRLIYSDGTFSASIITDSHLSITITNGTYSAVNHTFLTDEFHAGTGSHIQISTALTAVYVSGAVTLSNSIFMRLT